MRAVPALPENPHVILVQCKTKKYLPPLKIIFSPFLFPLFPPNGEEPSPSTGLGYWNVPNFGTRARHVPKFGTRARHVGTILEHVLLSRGIDARSSRLRDRQNFRCPPAGSTAFLSLSTDGKCFPCTNRRQSTQGRFLGQVGIVLNTGDHEDLINTALPDYNPTACLLESDSEEDETEVKIAKQHLLQLFYLFSYLQEESSAQEDEAAVDASGIPGWDRVDDLAKALAELGRMA